jgi:hypothetical protein
LSIACHLWLSEPGIKKRLRFSRGFVPAMSEPNRQVCLWCGRSFTRQAASILPHGLSQGLRCRRAPMDSPGDRRRHADGRCAPEWRYSAARVAPRGNLARAGTRRASKTSPCTASGMTRRGRRTARRIFLVALLEPNPKAYVRLITDNHRPLSEPKTAVQPWWREWLFVSANESG